MASDLANHIAAASTVLAGLQNSDPLAWARVSRAQRDVVQHALSKRSLAMAELSQVATAVRVSVFAEEDQLAIFRSMATTKACTPSDATGTPMMQDFESVLHFIPEMVWGAEGTQDFALSLMNFVVQLGLRNPTAPTVQLMSLLCSIGTDGMEHTMRMSPEARLANSKSWKKWLKRIVKGGIGEPTVWLAKLHPTPEALKAEHPELYASVYCASPPGAVKINTMALELLRAHTRMRREKGSAGPQGRVAMDNAGPRCMDRGDRLLEFVLQTLGARAADGINLQMLGAGGHRKIKIKIFVYILNIIRQM